MSGLPGTGAFAVRSRISNHVTDAGTPFAYITCHHVSPQAYGVLFGAGIAGIMITTWSIQGW